MRIESFTKNHLEEALELSLKCFPCESSFLRDENSEYKTILRKTLENLETTGLGLVAKQEGRMLGFLLSSRNGSPLGANCFSLMTREQKESLLHAAEENLQDHQDYTFALTLPIKDVQDFPAMGFSVEKHYALKHIQGTKVSSQILELPQEDFQRLKELREAFVSYLEGAPIYQKFTRKEKEEWFKPDGKRIFVLEEEGTYCGFFAVQKEGETYLAKGTQVWNSAGFYLDPKLRGKGLASLILSSVEEKLKEDGVCYLGTSYAETNSNGKRFWEKTFTPYAIRLQKNA